MENTIKEFPIVQKRFCLQIDSNATFPELWIELNGVLKKLEQLNDKKKEEFVQGSKNQKNIHITIYYE
ncbi:MAG: hypothetical protein JNJ40_06115 [Bacteroidia bacterium]|nr:hypothetical protein [Bacteroidia bacterium]